MENIEYSFNEYCEIKISWERDTRLFRADYFIGGKLQFFAKEKTIETVLSTLELMSPMFLGIKI